MITIFISSEMFNTTVRNLDSVVEQTGADISLCVFTFVTMAALVTNITLIKTINTRRGSQGGGRGSQGGGRRGRGSMKSATRVYITCVCVANMGK